MTPRRGPLLRMLLPALVLLLPSGSAAQDEARVRVQENFRQAPNGELLGRLDAGTPLTVVRRQGDWTQVELEGWIWTRSLQIVDRDGMDLVVAVDEGENLRDGPSGAVLGRLSEGTLLQERERIPGWIRATRRGWIWGPSLVVSAGTRSGTESEGETTSTPSAERDRPASRTPTGLVRSGVAGTAVLGAPDGDTLARTVPGSELEVLERQGGWARVRIEGWTWLPAGTAADGEPNATSTAAGPLEPSDLTASPDAFRGRVVTWRVQFISLEEAERVRTDFFEGEPFLLTRYGGTQGPFVYVAVSPERLDSVRGLTPLEYLTVTGRVRTGASALTGTPVLDLMSLAREGEDR